MSVTIYEIAKEANVSIATISRVLNNQGKIKDTTKERVLEVMKRLNYTPSTSARSLGRERDKNRIKNGRISVFVHEAIFSEGTHQYFPRIFSEIVQEAEKFRLKVIVEMLGKDSQERNIAAIWESQTDGVIIVGNCGDELVKEISRRKIPAVFAESYPKKTGFNMVNVDNFHGGYEAVNFLIESGHRKIGIITCWFEDVVAAERLNGARKAMKEHGLEYNQDYVQEGSCWPGGYEAVEKILAKNTGNLPTAIFALDDLSALEAVECLNKHGIKVPDDISVIGFDRVETYPKIISTITTVQVPHNEIGIRAVRRLEELLSDDDNNLSPTEILIPTKLIVNSTVKSLA